MAYEAYTPMDFAMDDYFQRWVQKPNPETSIFWENWLVEHPEKREMIHEARSIVLSMRFQDKDYTDAFIHKIWQNIDEQISVTDTIRPLHADRPAAFGRFVSHYKRIAAVLIIFLVSVFIVMNLLNAPEKYTTAYGETRTVLLPDSSVVTLNANSKLHFQNNWQTATRREVWLEGEAFFHVRKVKTSQQRIAGNQHVKFIVHTGLVDVEVLGTQFNVNTRRGKAQVVLNSGKVKLSREESGKENSMLMQPGEMVEISEKNEIFSKKSVNVEVYSSWRNKQFVFDQTPIAEIAKMLEDRYGWQVAIRNPALADMTFTSTIPADNPDMVLKLLAESFKVKITRKGNEVTMDK